MLLETLSHFFLDAKNILQHQKELIIVDFSDNFYSIQIPCDTAPEGFWSSSLKISAFGEIENAFCSCPDGDCCHHLLTAFLSIFDNPYLQPLHVLFQNSFWWTFFHHLFENNKHLEDIGDMLYKSSSSSYEIEIKFLSNEAFLSWVSCFSSTNQSSTTFSKSSLYKAAKYFFFLVNQGHTLNWNKPTNEASLPHEFSLSTKHVILKGSIKDTKLLNKIFSNQLFAQTNLKCLNSFKVTNIDINEESYNAVLTKTFSNTDNISKDSSTIPLNNNLIYSPSQHTILAVGVELITITLNLLPFLSNEWKALLVHILPYHEESIPLRYQIQVSRDAILSFSTYLNTIGDLEEGILISPSYCCIPGKGLFKVSRMLSNQKTFHIPADQVENFIDTHKNNLKEPGFEVFDLQSSNEPLTFCLTENNTLLFHYDSQSTYAAETHYGKWLYKPQKGFILKSQQQSSIHDGLIVEESKISEFIKNNSEELSLVPGFFTPTSPLSNLTFTVTPNLKSRSLVLKPNFIGLEGETCKLLENYIYWHNYGFIVLPEELQFLSTLPQKVSSQDVLNFITTYVNSPYFQFESAEITIPQHIELIITSINRPLPASPLHLQVLLKTNIGVVPLKDILLAIQKKHRYLFSQAGFINLENSLPQFLQLFLSTHNVILEDNVIITSITDIFKLDALAPLSLDPNVQASEKDLAFFSQLKDSCLPPIPKELFSSNHNLRPYQNNGLLWLWFLYNHHLSGLLCDDMGLGKTHQTTALLDIVAQLVKQESPPKFLVVCPTSVLSHWENILRSHLPLMNVQPYYGIDRPKTISFDNSIIVTTYGTLRQNYKMFYENVFTITVFDEIHIAKNKNSQIHKILARLDSQMKLGLTGTPIENNLMEFKSLFDIILPNYLPSDNLFKNMFIKKQADSTDKSSQELLLKLTRPFILRRTKQLVLPELPDKVESIIPCQLTKEQSDLYETVLQQDSPFLRELNETNNKSFIHIFALLNHLKQICNHPAVYLKKPQDYKNHSSGKWNTFTRLLEESLESGYKVVIFSQYIHMINIMSMYLKEKNIDFTSIQGKSLNRKEQIERFASDPNCKVFIGSLLASGTGINLTAGNVVIMYDRWWNPAKENQALDRVHRIGQKQTVFIYKLLTENTLEERIHHLIQQKNALLKDFIVNQDSSLLHMLNKDDLLTILNYKEENAIGTDTEQETHIEA